MSLVDTTPNILTKYLIGTATVQIKLRIGSLNLSCLIAGGTNYGYQAVLRTEVVAIKFIGRYYKDNISWRIFDILFILANRQVVLIAASYNIMTTTCTNTYTVLPIEEK